MIGKLKEKKLESLILLILILIIVVIILIFTTSIKDNERFKKDYEVLNGEVVGENTYQTLDISEDNIVSYLSLKETIKFLNNSTGLIYIGKSDSALCRQIVPVLLEAVTCACLESLYYLDTDDLSDYDDLVDLLSEYITSNTIEDGVPIVVGVKNGKIVGIFVGSMSEEDIYDTLSDDEYDTLKSNYLDIIEDLEKEETTCSDAC